MFNMTERNIKIYSEHNFKKLYFAFVHFICLINNSLVFNNFNLFYNLLLIVVTTKFNNIKYR